MSETKIVTPEVVAAEAIAAKSASPVTEHQTTTAKGLTTDEAPLLDIQHVAMNYQNGKQTVPALGEVNLQIYPGEFVCVMGPSGCGKSTLLNILAGFMAPSEGQVLLNQTPIKGTDAQRGVVFQNAPLYDWYSVRDNIAFGPKMKHVDQAQIKADVDYYLDEVGLTEFGDKHIYELSGGMKQRANIASSLINDPDILLMDEPFGALDALTREQMQTLVRRIWHETGKTIFFITHDVDEALLLGTHILVMSKHPGRVIADFSADFTTRLIGDQSQSVRYTPEFGERRQYILKLINGQ
jgi:taurine transport system ATP-binding protein